MSKTSSSKLTARERIAKARINLLTDFPFFGNIAMKLVPREVSEEESKAFGITTMAVDMYGNLMFYPPWVQAQTDTVMKAGVSHEVLHVCLKHLSRLGTREPRTWNIAVDATVNETLSYTFKIPDTWVMIPQMKRKCAEEIYDWVIKNAKTYKMPASGGFDSHIFGKEGDKSGEGDGKNKSDQQQGAGGGKQNSPFYQEGQQAFDAQRAVREAYNFAKSQGKLPAGLDRMFADILNPILDWKDILRKFIVQVIPHDFSYTRPSKKSYSVGYYMPMIKREQVELVIGVDSSGSISDKEYAEFLTEIYSMCRQFECIRATVLVCDAAITEVAEIDENFNPYSIKGRGYGGTDSIPVYKWIEDEKENNIKILVYFSDGYINIPDKEYPFPTLWIITSHGRTDEVDKQRNAVVVQIPALEGGQGRDDDDE